MARFQAARSHAFDRVRAALRFQSNIRISAVISLQVFDSCIYPPNMPIEFAPLRIRSSGISWAISKGPVQNPNYIQVSRFIRHRGHSSCSTAIPNGLSALKCQF